MQLGFFFDQTRCIGCYTCQVACKDWHDIPAGAAGLMRVTCVEKGRFPNLFMAYMINPCFHCSDPPCIPACPAGAIGKRAEDGVVTVDGKKCLRCTGPFCLDACPYDSPQFVNGKGTVMQKCDFCLDRLSGGKQPICVAACPMRALDYGDLEALAEIKGGARDAAGFNYVPEVKPSIVIKPRRQKENAGNILQIPAP